MCHFNTKTSVFPQFYPKSDTSSPACLLSVNDDDDDDDEYIIEKNDDENVCLLDDDVGGFNAFNNNIIRNSPNSCEVPGS